MMERKLHQKPHILIYECIPIFYLCLENIDKIIGVMRIWDILGT